MVVVVWSLYSIIITLKLYNYVYDIFDPHIKGVIYVASVVSRIQV